MVIFGVSCVLVKQGGHDLYGEAVAGARINEKCAVVRLEESQQGSTVRVDSGATRGGADEARNVSRLLMKKTSTVALDDIIEMEGLTMRVMSKRLRYSIHGKIDHFEIEGIRE